MNRRQFLQGTVAVSVLVFSTGCGSSSIDSFSQTNVAAPAARVETSTEFLEIDGRGGSTFRLFRRHHRLESLDSNGGTAWVLQGPGTEPGGLTYPRELVQDANGFLYLLDSATSGVSVYDSAGIYQRELDPGEGGLLSIGGLAICQETLYVSDPAASNIKLFSTADLRLLEQFGVPGDEPGQLRGPTALSFDSAQRLHVLDSSNGRVSVYDKSGNFVTIYGQSNLVHPVGLSTATSSYVVDAALDGVWVFGETFSNPSFVRLVDTAGRALQPVAVSATLDGSLRILVNTVEEQQASREEA